GGRWRKSDSCRLLRGRRWRRASRHSTKGCARPAWCPTISPEVTGKRLELLQQVVPGLTGLAVLSNRGNPVAVAEVKETESAARALGIQVHPVGVQSARASPPPLTSITQP